MWGEYVGIPFAEHGRTREGCDCYGLVRLVQAEQFGRTLPMHGGDYDFTDREEESRLIDDGLALIGAARVEDPEPGDIVHLVYAGKASHIGVYIGDGRMLHVERLNGYASIARLDSTQYRSRIVGYFRLPGGSC